MPLGGGSGGLLVRLHRSEPAARSMLGNSTLIRENKEGAGLRGGMPGTQPRHLRSQGLWERGRQGSVTGVSLEALPTFVN